MKTPRTAALFAFITLGVAACSDATAPTAPSEVSVAAPLTAKGGPKASPSAGRIYFASDIAGSNFDFELYSMNPDGSDRRRLTYSEGYERYPSVSRDGKKLAFGLSDPNTGNGELYTMNTDGSGRRRVLSTPDYNSISYSSWSPDGKRIAFQRTMNAEDKRQSVWVVSTNGAALTRLTPQGVDAYTPAWSPDGSRIAYSALDPQTEKWNLMIMNADGSNVQTLYECPGVGCFQPDWAPDGLNLVFSVLHSGGTRELTFCRLNSFGASCGPTPSDPPILGHMARYAPDGSKLVVLSNQASSGTPQFISTMDANGSGAVTVTSDVSLTFGITWGR